MNIGKRWLVGAAALSLVAGVTMVRAADEAKFSVKEFMKTTHKGDDAVVQKAIGGKATKEEIQKLVDGYQAMEKADAPKGDAKSWKEKTAALVKAAQSLAAGDKDGAANLKAAANCKACHMAHRPMPPR